MGLMSYIFGEGGVVAIGLSSIWYLAGFFILLFFLFYLYSRRSGTENIVVFIALFITLSIEFSLFAFPNTIIIIISFALLLYTAQYLFYWFNK